MFLPSKDWNDVRSILQHGIDPRTKEEAISADPVGRTTSTHAIIDNHEPRLRAISGDLVRGAILGLAIINDYDMRLRTMWRHCLWSDLHSCDISTTMRQKCASCVTGYPAVRATMCRQN